MPARHVTRCRPRTGVDLDLVAELNLVEWSPILPHTMFKTFDAMRAVWDRHGRTVLPHYIRQRPGTRPFALYALGELPLPRLRHQPARHALTTVIEGRGFYAPWHYWGTVAGDDGWFCGGTCWGEFQHLRGLGVIDAAEGDAADEWIDDRHYDPDRDRRHYAPLSRREVPPELIGIELEETDRP